MTDTEKAALRAAIDIMDGPCRGLSTREWQTVGDVLRAIEALPSGETPTCATCEGRREYERAKDWRPSGLKGMHWAKQPDWELCERGGKGRCSVWLNGTWHTWDKHGTGGENGREATVEDAFREAEAAMVRQGWAKREPSPSQETQTP